MAEKQDPKEVEEQKDNKELCGHCGSSGRCDCDGWSEGNCCCQCYGEGLIKT